MPRNSRSKQPSPVAADIEPRVINSFADVQSLRGGKALVVSIMVRGEATEWRGRNLSPDETKEIKLLMQQALPPVIPESQGVAEHYDIRDPKYLKEQEVNKFRAMALALYWAFPCFSAHAENTPPPLPANPSTDELARHFGRMDVDTPVLEHLFYEVTKSHVQVRVGAHLSFI